MILVEEGTIQTVINTLKGIDVKGFDSMDKLVGVVMVLTNVLNNGQRAEIIEQKESDDIGTD